MRLELYKAFGTVPLQRSHGPYRLYEGYRGRELWGLCRIFYAYIYIYVEGSGFRVLEAILYI